MAMYMQIPTIAGDVTAKGHEKWIDLTSFRFHVERQITAHAGRLTDREVTRPYISHLELTKRVDCTTPKLFREACVGQALPQTKIQWCLTNNNLDPYFEFTLKNVIVCYFGIETVVGTEPLLKLHLSFERIEMKYTPYDSNHRPLSPIPSGYDLRTATAL